MKYLFGKCYAFPLSLQLNIVERNHLVIENWPQSFFVSSPQEYPTLCLGVNCVQYSDKVHLCQSCWPSQSLDGSTMETSKEQTQRLALQFSSADQTISHVKKGSFDGSKS